ncbi:MAG TPA: flagellar hook-associated protein FlgL [Rhodocyclaceae bacterium]|nr:flagellar hook-associated protein FlgL [Rhodocyclaceae bacterium]
MRISTSILYDTNVATMNNQQTNLLQLQQELSLGTRVLTPSDDPVASAAALDVSQSEGILAQHTNNQGAANDSLANLDSTLSSIGDIVSYVKERTVQAGDGALSPADRKSIATDVRGQFASLLGLANGTDLNGQYMFSGFKGDTVPFTGSLQGGVTYQGDQGQRTLEVSSSRQMPVSNNGDEVFMNIDNLNGRFNTSQGSTNAGGAIISDGTVVGPYANGKYGIKFTSPTTYAIYDRAADPTMTGAPLGTGTYTDGAPIDIPPAPATAQIQVSIAGTPATGETYQMDPGGTTSMFTIFQQLVGALENTTGNSYQTAVSDALGRLDNAQDNILKLRAKTGAQQTEVSALQDVGQGLKVQYATQTNRLTGLDYASAISDLQQQQNSLDASQKSFVKITSMSLFDLL